MTSCVYMVANVCGRKHASTNEGQRDSEESERGRWRDRETVENREDASDDESRQRANGRAVRERSSTSK